eukprot:evm.model.scf_1201.3 EVM.evm.TU.scf_1201.3   scf_1201:28438-32863(+)
MGICLSAEAGEVPRAAELGLPRNFTVFKELGAGGEGRTYLVRERLGNGRSELFAAKVAPRGAGLDVGYLLQGIKNQCALSHVNIIRLLEVILTHSHVIIKLEYAQGGELSDYIARQHAQSSSQQLSEEHARFLFMQMLDAVAHCHERGIVHRDIKLSNVLLDSGKCPRVKVCDFGLSRELFTGDSRCCPPAGTPMYMPPEVLKNVVRRAHTQHDPVKSDMWSLGVLLFTMLLGRFPFGAQKPFGGPALSRGAGRLTRSQGNISAGAAGPRDFQRSDFRFLLRNMVKAHSSDLKRLRSETWGTRKLSPDCRDLMDGLLAMDPSKRLGLAGAFAHKWVNGPLFLEHAQTIARGREEMEKRQDEGEGLKGAKAGLEDDAELAAIAAMAAAVGTPGDELLRWTPPRERAGREQAGVADEELFDLPGGLRDRAISI